MSQKNTRTLIFKLHTWLGLHLFALMALFFLTGTVLVFIEQVDSLVVPDSQLETPVAFEDRASFGTLFDQAQAYAPEGSVLGIHRAGSDWIADHARISSPDHGGQARLVWFSDSSSAIGLETGPRGLGDVILEIHANFLTGHRIGALLASGFSFILLGFLISGMISYRRFWRGFFRLPPRHQGARGWWGGLHRLSAVWSLPFLLIIALTGLYFFAQTLGFLAAQPLSQDTIMPRESVLPAGFDGAALDQAVASAQSAAPKVHFHKIGLPHGPSDGITLYGLDDTLLTNYYANRIIIDPSNLAIVDMELAGDLSFVDRLSQIIYQLHFGHWGGFAGQLLWVLFGLLATLLSVAGSMIYASRVRQPDTHVGAFRRIWSGMSVLKWGLPLFFAALIALFFIRYL